MRKSYGVRSELAESYAARSLLWLMESKETNLAVAADLNRARDVLDLLDAVGPEICIAKTHADIIEDFTPRFAQQLEALANRHNFLIFEDRKFSDIGSTVQMQYEGGKHHIARWADIINAHTVAGPGTIEGLKGIGYKRGVGLVLVAEMTSEGTLARGQYTEDSIEMAQKYADFVIGFITARKLIDNPGFINFTPGIKFEGGEDGLGQQYNTPEKAIANGSDVLIVGRGIYMSPDPIEAAKEYRKRGWEAYLKTLA